MQSQVTSIGAFVGGLNTEQPQLADQIQYTTDELNCQLLPDGTRARRYGVTREENSVGFPMSYEDEEGTTTEKLNIRYDSIGDFKVNITEAGVYTIWMSGGGAKEEVVKSSRKFSYGHIYNLIHGSGGGAIKFYAYLTEGEYSVTVGAQGLYTGITYMGGGFYYWNDAAPTTFKGANIDIFTGGGSSRVYWLKEAREYSSYEGHTSHRGAVVINEAPSNFTIASRTSDNEFSPTSGLTGNTGSPGAINQNGYFRIAQGIVSGNGVDEGEDTIIDIDEGQATAYYWANYDKEGSDCIVVQVGGALKFFEATRPFDSTLIAELMSTEMFIKDSAFKTYSFSSGEGFLLCTSEYSTPFYVTLDKTAATATPTPINLQIRDLAGVNDYLTVDESPSTLTNEHRYNLLNQGWDDAKINSYQSSQSYYPSNALIWWYGKDLNGDFNVGTLTKVYFGTTPAPKGHYILDYFNQDRSGKSGVPGIDPVVKNRYAIDSAFFAGRFFYLVGSTVLFSQIIREDIRNIGKCYQDADPTSQTVSDIIATDGGEIIFQELGYGKAIKKFPLGLLAFGTKSVYAITSTSSNTFSATQYLTQFVTHAGCVSGKSVVGVEDVMYYWSPQGIYQITVDQVSGTQAIASSVTADTIQSWYNDLPDYSKENCVGAYDYTNRRIVWLYPTSKDNLQNRDGVLVYYLDFKAFLPSKISEGGNLITVFETILPTYLIPSIALFAGDYEVVAGTNDVIVKDFGEEYARNYSVCYLGYIKSFDRLFFCDFYSRNFLDWQESFYKSYAISYPITFGSTWKKQYTPTLQCYFLRTEEDELTDGTYLAPSSCYLSARWKWADTQESDRWDLTQNAYIRIPRFMEFRYVNGKIRVRGSGPAVQYKIESKDDDDFKLSGMNMLIRTV